MIKSFLYDAEGHDRETSLDDDLPQLEEQHLLWVDVVGRDAEELARLGRILKLNPQSVFELRSWRRSFALNHYGDYFQFDVPSIADQEARETALKVTRAFRLDFIVGPQ